jgi:Bardet-Biedl syndrome 7 protein
MSYRRVDLLQVGSTSPDTLQLFPLGKKSIVQKVIVGDNNGVVQCFTVKRGAVLV